MPSTVGQRQFGKSPIKKTGNARAAFDINVAAAES